MTRRPFRLLDAFCVVGGVAGVVAAHAIDFAAVFPNRGVRAAQLAATGHTYWHLAGTAAFAGAVLAALAAFARGVVSAVGWHGGPRPEGGNVRPGTWWSSAQRLAAFQVVLFVAMEAAERAHAGLPVTQLAHERTFAVGVVLQLAVAAALALALLGIEHLGRRTGALLTPQAPARRAPGRSLAPTRVLRNGTARTGDRQRAPPLPA